MAKQIFVNLPVKDLNKTIKFFMAAPLMASGNATPIITGGRLG